jgi:hypothetical protein
VSDRSQRLGRQLERLAPAVCVAIIVAMLLMLWWFRDELAML